LVYGFSFYFVDFDVGRLWSGLPKLAHRAVKAWPPDTSELGVLIKRAIETVAMAVVGTTIGVVIAAPCCILAAQNITPSRLLYTPMRWFLNTLRGIDSFIFALLFVAAVGLGPFAGVLGIGLHSAGTIAKLWSEAIEAVEPGPLEAAALTGANRLKVISYALLPDVLPNLTSITLYVWEFNVRSSTVLGVVRRWRDRAGAEEQRRPVGFRAPFHDHPDHPCDGDRDRSVQRMAAAETGVTAALAADPAIRIIGLSERFGDRIVLDDVSFEVAAGEVVAILGASGAGKTTLFRCVTRLAQSDGGQIFLGEHTIRTLGGRQLSMARSEIGLIFQQFNLIRRLNALDNVLVGRLGEVATWRVMLRRFPRSDRQLALAALDRVGMLPYAL
jgi:phosphonate transport system permease protein